MNSFRVLFFIKKTKLRKNGEAPICMRVTLNGERAEVLIKRTVNPQKWNAQKEYATGNDKATQELNYYIDSSRAKVLAIQREMLMEREPISAKTIIDRFFGRNYNDEQKTLIELYTDHNKDIRSMIGKGYAEVTVNRFDSSLIKLKDFLQHQYETTDITFAHMDNMFIRKFDVYLRSKCGLHHNTVLKHMKNLKKIYRIAQANGWVKRDAFFGYLFKEQETVIEFLTKDEILRIIEAKFESPQLDLVRDIFLFCCFTGLAYIDAKTLRPQHIVTDDEGQLWIKKKRQKTGSPCSVELVTFAVKILEKYKEHPVCVSQNVCLPVYSNIVMNGYLNDIAKLCGIEKPITTHIARHSCATSVLLANKVSIENVSKILGHKSVKMTQRYAKVLDASIKSDMRKVEEAFS